MTTTNTATATDFYQMYGIVEATARIPVEPVRDATGPRLIRHGTVGALVTGPLDLVPRVSRAALLAHAGLLDRLATTMPVLPARFGTVLIGHDQVLEMLATYEDRFRADLAEVRGRTQFTVKVRHNREEVLREVLAEQPEIARLHALVVDDAGDGRYSERVRLGELVARALTVKCEQDTQTVWDELAPHAVAGRPRAAGGPETSFGAAFLVDDAHRRAFEAAAEELGRRWYARARVRLLGPLAAYDFVSNPTDRPTETRG